MDKDHMRILVKNVDTQLFEIVNNLICSICQELFSKPVTTPCGHTFCNGCIKRVLSSKDNNGCPLCKNSFKRYGLQSDEVKSTLTKICQELPAAFEKDVKEFTNSLSGLEDLVRTSKLSQLYNQDLVKESKTKKQKTTSNRKSRKTNEELAENDSGTFVPVLKRTKNVLEYASAKKKRLDDLVSVSQTEPASNSSFGDSSELEKKLEKIEKLPPEKKVNEWFNAVGDNIYINSPTSSILEQTGLEGDKSEGEKSTMIRRDYNKSRVFSKNEPNGSIPTDPYEFVPSQNNNNIIKKKRQKKSGGRKIPDFKALQSFSKESIKRNNILLDDNREEEAVEEHVRDSPSKNQITASQKFDQLLSETKGEQKVSHVLYSASQSSSTQFLDVSFHSKIEKVNTKKTPKEQKKLLEEVLFKNVEPSNSSRGRSKKRKSVDGLRGGKKKKILTELVQVKSDEASELEESIERYLVKGHKKPEPPPTKLGQLLKELLDDDIIYATRPANGPVRLPELDIESVDLVTPLLPMTQNTQMIGFCTQEETPDVRDFKEMVENMEKELNCTAYRIEEPKGNLEDNHPRATDEKLNEENPRRVTTEEKLREETTCRVSTEEKLSEENPCRVSTEEKLNEENPRVGSPVSEEANDSCDLNEENLKNPERLVRFLHLGRLTPMRKRTKTTVVKLVFPIGLSSLARRRALQNRVSPKAQVTKKQVCQVSTGIQTSQQTESSMIQTSQVPRCSVHMQTSQEVKPSVEIQTTQRWTTSAEIQTSQMLVCQEIQTTQIGYESAQVQTTQPQLSANPETLETPIRKPSHQHRKIIKRKNSNETEPESPPISRTPEKENVVEKDVIMDFETEDDFEDPWRKTQKHKHLVELKNKKNKERNEKTVRQKSGDVESDDSDVLPPKRRGTYRILSQDPAGILEDYETRQVIPLDVRKISEDEEAEVVDLDTPKSLNSEEQMMRVLKNIDLDLPRGKNIVRGEKSEESDSDFFVEQTPPRPTSRPIEDIKTFSRSRGLTQALQKQPEKENEPEKKENSEGTDLIGDSIPKGFSESFLLLSAPQRIPLTAEKNSREESQKKTIKIDPTIDPPDENDQNQLNSFEGRTKPDPKTVQLKTAVDPRKRLESSPPVRATQQKRICVVASSVRNPELIKKFVNKFKVEYLNKPTKDMTHLIVGLHENDDKEVLPLCTPKLLFAMANKKWVVSELWAETCLKMNLILPEDSFETPDPVGGCGCRKARLSCEQLLRNCEVYLLGEFQMISKEEFSDLITDCGGTLVSSPERFSFLPSKLRMIIADRDCLKLNEKQLQDLYQKHSTVILSRDVIIMSIQSYKLVNFSSYLLHSASEEFLVKLGYPSALVKNEEEEEEELEEEEGEDGNRSIAR